MDKVRAVMLALEAQERPYFMSLNPPSVGGTDGPQETADYIMMLHSAGFLDKAEKTHTYRISWAGHEFLDTVRDPDIWRQTKEGASKLGSWSVKVLGELAIGFVKLKAHQLGLPIS